MCGEPRTLETTEGKAPGKLLFFDRKLNVNFNDEPQRFINAGGGGKCEESDARVTRPRSSHEKWKRKCDNLVEELNWHTAIVIVFPSRMLFNYEIRFPFSHVLSGKRLVARHRVWVPGTASSACRSLREVDASARGLIIRGLLIGGHWLCLALFEAPTTTLPANNGPFNVK